MHSGQKTRVDSDEGSSYGERIVLYIPKQPHRSDRLRELENLQNLEIKMKGRNRKRDWEDSSDDLDYVANRSSRGSGSCETVGCYHESPHRERHGHRNATLDVMSRALRRAT